MNEKTARVLAVIVVLWVMLMVTGLVGASIYALVS